MSRSPSSVPRARTRRPRTEPTTEARARKKRPGAAPAAREGPTALIAYLRVSTEEQTNGPEVQRAEIERFARGLGLPVRSWHEDRVSGGAPLDRRPALMDALDALGPGVALVVQKRDRLARDVATAAVVTRMADKQGSGVLCANGAGNGDGPEAALMRSILDAFAEYERALNRARTRGALARKKARGEAISKNPPFGWRKVDRGDLPAVLEPDQAQQEVRARILALREGGASYGEIANVLTEEGVPGPRGPRWHRGSIARIVDYEPPQS